MSEQSESGAHQMAITVNWEEGIDPDRVEEWVRANFDHDQSVVIQDLDGDNAWQYDGGEFRDAL